MMNLRSRTIVQKRAVGSASSAEHLGTIRKLKGPDASASSYTTQHTGPPNDIRSFLATPLPCMLFSSVYLLLRAIEEDKVKGHDLKASAGRVDEVYEYSKTVILGLKNAGASYREGWIRRLNKLISVLAHIKDIYEKRSKRPLSRNIHGKQLSNNRKVLDSLLSELCQEWLVSRKETGDPPPMQGSLPLMEPNGNRTIPTQTPHQTHFGVPEPSFNNYGSLTADTLNAVGNDQTNTSFDNCARISSSYNVYMTTTVNNYY